VVVTGLNPSPDLVAKPPTPVAHRTWATLGGEMLDEHGATPPPPQYSTRSAFGSESWNCAETDEIETRVLIDVDATAQDGGLPNVQQTPEPVQKPRFTRPEQVASSTQTPWRPLTKQSSRVQQLLTR
jgi:hypothetical protein